MCYLQHYSSLLLIVLNGIYTAHFNILVRILQLFKLVFSWLVMVYIDNESVLISSVTTVNEIMHFVSVLLVLCVSRIIRNIVIIFTSV